MTLLVLDTSVVLHALGEAAPAGQHQQAEDARQLLALTGQYDFAIAAAVIAARLWNARARGSSAGERQVVKVDLQIAATAIRWDAKAFCTFEDQQKKRIQAVAPGVTAGAPIVFLPGQKRLPF